MGDSATILSSEDVQVVVQEGTPDELRLDLGQEQPSPEGSNTASVGQDQPSPEDSAASPATSLASPGVTLTNRSLEEMPTVMDWEEVSSEASDAINNVVEGIVERMRVERMFELRRIQHGDRAVSSGERAQQLETLFNAEPEEVARRAPGSEGVRNELEALANTRSVGNLLSTRFRTLLENSLSAPPQSTTTTRPRPVPAQARATMEQLQTRLEAVQRAPAPAPAPAAPPPPPAHPQQTYTPPEFAERQFDYAITDVEELFQRRLVSDVLHSAFRNVLELHIERRLVRTGTTPRQRFTPAAAPQQPTQLHQQLTPIVASSSRRLPEIERQMHVMSIEMKEMKGMLKLLVDTQLDMQRSIRQEVSAMMRGEEPTRPTRQLKEGQCVVCLEAPSDTVLYRCGHLCCCFSCARQLKVAGHHCPVCRAEVTDILRVYRSTNDSCI